MIPGRGDPVLDAVVLTDGSAITATGPDTLGPQAPRSGQLRPGYDADLITMDVDPLTDLKAFSDSDRIAGVWKAGQRVKG